MISVGLAGLGRIGFQYDSDRDDLLISHFKAIKDNPDFQLRWVADPNPENRARVREELPKNCATTEAIPEMPVDLVVVATDTRSHMTAVGSALRCSPKVIFCEKPVGMSLKETLHIAQLCESAQVALYVNYMRRCEPAVKHIQRLITSAELGEFYKAVCWYSGGIANNASHFIDLLQFWFGDVCRAELLAPPQSTNADPDFDFRLQFTSGLFCYFLAGNEAHFGSKEIELLGTTGSLRYLRGGFDVQFHRKKPHEKFSNYVAYGVQGESINTDYSHFMRHVYQHLQASVLAGHAFPSTIATALRTREVIDDLLTQLGNTYGKSGN